MYYVVFGTGTLTGGLIFFFIFKIKMFRDGLKDERQYAETREFHKSLTQQTDLSSIKDGVQIIEFERLRISADIHDDVAQSLSALFIDIDRAQENSNVSPEAKRALEKIGLKLETVIESLRDIIYGMMPIDLQNKNLVEAIAALCKRHNKNKSTRINFESKGELSVLPEQHRLHIYRITQELLSNCKKHAHATLCSVQLQWSETELILTVFDNGVGLKNSIKEDDGYGIRGIIARCIIMKVVPSFNFQDSGLEFILRLPLN